MKTTFTRVLVTGLAMHSLGAVPALAGEFFERNGLALGGYDPVSYFTDHKPSLGVKEHTAVYKGSKFQFTSAEHRDAFTKAPEQYSPQFDGFCAYGVSQGAKAKIEPDQFAVLDGKLYLNYDAGVSRKWNADREALLKKANANWSEVKKLTKVVW